MRTQPSHTVTANITVYVVDLPHTVTVFLMIAAGWGSVDGIRMEGALFFGDVYRKPLRGVPMLYIYIHVRGLRRAYRSFCKNRTLMFTTKPAAMAGY